MTVTNPCSSRTLTTVGCHNYRPSRDDTWDRDGVKLGSWDTSLKIRRSFGDVMVDGGSGLYHFTIPLSWNPLKPLLTPSRTFHPFSDRYRRRPDKVFFPPTETLDRDNTSNVGIVREDLQTKDRRFVGPRSSTPTPSYSSPHRWSWKDGFGK